MKNPEEQYKKEIRIQDPFKQLRYNFLQKQSTAFSR